MPRDIMQNDPATVKLSACFSIHKTGKIHANQQELRLHAKRLSRDAEIIKTSSTILQKNMTLNERLQEQQGRQKGFVA